MRARLAFVEQYVKERLEGFDTLRSVAEDVLKESARFRLDTMDSYRWRSLAETVYAEDPVGMTRLGVFAAQEDAQRYGFLDEEARQVLFTAVAKANPTEKARILEEVLGPALETTPGILWSLDDLFEKRLLDQFDPDQVMSWTEQSLEQRLPLIASAAPVHSQPLAGLARTLLVYHGDRDDVRSALAATFGTGGWTGSESEWIAGKLGQLEHWAEDPHPNVRRWAVDMQEYYRRRLERTRLLEEEEPY